MIGTNEWLASLAQPKGLLESVQRRGRNSLADMGMPTSSQEAWRLTNLKRLEEILKLPLASDVSKQQKLASPLLPNPSKGAMRLVIDPQTDPLDSICLPEGFIPLTTSEIEQTLGQTMKKCSSYSDWPVAINHASTSNVFALRVVGKELPPLELVMQSYPAEFNPTRVLLVLEENAQLDLLQVVLGLEESAYSHLIEIHLSQESCLNHGWLAIGQEDTKLMANLAVKQEKRSQYSLTSCHYGWTWGRLKSSVLQLEGNAKTNLRGLQISMSNEQLETHSDVRFEGPEGSLNQLNKSVAGDNSHSIFNGAIRVPQVAQLTNASQLSRNLLLSNRARIDTKPELEIVADDVRCAHGATVSELQQEEIFYLRSRGISAERATALLLQGYCQEILSTLPLDGERWINLQELLRTVKE